MNDTDRSAIVKGLEDAPFSKAVGLKVERARDGEAIARMPMHPSLLNPGGPQAPIHGGAIATLADFAACAAVWTLPETISSATISMTINYTAPGVQTDLIARARVRRKGKRIASLTVEVRDTADTLIADALITYKIA
jgi:uncharacterized protein (TIGR00369 family)